MFITTLFNVKCFLCLLFNCCASSISRIPNNIIANGSLGHGLGVGAGFATANYKDKQKQNIYVIISEGELYEGSTWETLLYISHYQLKNIKIIIDVNNLIILGNTNELFKTKSD